MSGKRKSTTNEFPAPQEKKMKSAPGHWSQGLYAALQDTSIHLYSDDDMVIIKDKYPKAKYHYLVMPKKKIPNLKHLTKDDIPLLEKMYKQACLLTAECTVKRFRYGYHAIPSMGLLHLHAISQDFNSDWLKTKKHWNSFTTDYFVDSSDILKMLHDNGKVDDMTHCNKLLISDLRCHCCNAVLKNVPALKSHVIRCFKDDISS